jgi:MoxR-like ATPase
MAPTPSRHTVDTSVTFQRDATLPGSKRIEQAGAVVAKTKPPTEAIQHEAYIADEGLERVVNLAIALGRPLLLQGDAGCGKTRLAHAVAYSLGLPLEEAYIKSTSRAQDLLYTYDAVARLYEAQLEPKTRPTTKRKAESGERASEIRRFIRYGPLGRAIIRASYGRRSVVLIDEIDKADLDFPNDLLRELDRLEFEVAEDPALAYAVPNNRPDLRPIIFVTHNEEKALPAAFLRRCIFYYLEFPKDPALLDRILAGHKIANAALRSKAISVVSRLRGRNLLKRPGLSELLDWAGYLQAAGLSLESIEQLPAPEALIKHAADLRQAEEEFPPKANGVPRRA